MDGLSSRRRRLTLFACSAALAADPYAASAVPLAWSPAADPAAFSSPANWTPAQSPAPADDLTFAPPGSTTARLSADAAVRSIHASAGNTILDLGGALDLSQSLTVSASDAHTTLTVNGPRPLTTGYLILASSADDDAIRATLDLRTATTVGIATLGMSGPNSDSFTIARITAPLTVTGALTVGDGGYCKFDAFAPVSAHSVTLAVNRGGTNATFGGPLAVATDLRIGTETGHANANFYGGAVSVGGNLTIGSLTPTPPDYYSTWNLVYASAPTIDVAKGLTIHANAELDLFRSHVHAPNVTNHGKLVADATLHGDLLNTGIIEPRNLTVEGAFTRTASASLYFPSAAIFDTGRLNLAGPVSYDPAAPVHVLFQGEFVPKRGDRFVLIDSPVPLPVSPDSVHLQGIMPAVPFHLDTSRGLSIVFDADASPVVFPDAVVAVRTWSRTTPAGRFDDPANWGPFPVAPERHNTALFDSGDHAVTVDRDVHIFRLRVDDGAVRLDLAGHSLTTDLQSGWDGDIDVGNTAGSNASLTLVGGFPRHRHPVLHRPPAPLRALRRRRHRRPHRAQGRPPQRRLPPAQHPRRHHRRRLRPPR